MGAQVRLKAPKGPSFLENLLCFSVLPGLVAGRQDQDMIVAARTEFGDEGEVNVPSTGLVDRG